jgi:hypothetical protein
MSDVTNTDRATWAHAALCAFAEETGQLNDLTHDPESVVGDLIADLRHWTDVDDLDWSAIIRRADMHYESETMLESDRVSIEIDLVAGVARYRDPTTNDTWTEPIS